MRELEDAVRGAASALKQAITNAEAGGLRVVWPHAPKDLDAIAISATGRVTNEAKPALSTIGVTKPREQTGAATGIPIEGIELPADGVVREYDLDSRSMAPAAPIDPADEE